MAKQKLGGDILAECPSCNEKHILDAWDNMTSSKCTSRKMRRDYVSCREQRAYDRINKVYYECPSCQKLVPACNLKLEQNNNRIIIYSNSVSGMKIPKYIKK